MNKRLLKIIPVFLVPVFLSLLPLPATAEGDKSSIPLQFISLTDGTLIRGRLMSIQNGDYIIQTEHLGEIRVNPENIQSISSGKFQRKEEAPARLPILGGNLSPGKGCRLGSAGARALLPSAGIFQKRCFEYFPG